MNKNNEFLYRVASVKVFGSYLSDQQVLGDLDVGIKLVRKVEGEEFLAWNKKRISIALKGGRRFSNYIDEIYWPFREVMLHLNTKKKGLSLHDEESDDVIKRTECRVVYQSKNN